VDKTHLTQFGRAMKQLGIEMIPAYSPEARGREPSGRLAPIRGGCPRNSRQRASPCCRRPTGIWRRCIVGCRNHTFWQVFRYLVFGPSKIGVRSVWK
jgi:hypothetical protein